MSSVQPVPAPLTEQDPGIEVFLTLKKEYGLYSGTEIGPAARRLHPVGAATDHLVQGMIAPRTVNILVGDSGIGKSPLTYQLALAIASGTPFLGIPTRRAKVLLIDYENALPDVHWMVQQTGRHLGLTKYPAEFLLWPYFLRPAPPKTPYDGLLRLARRRRRETPEQVAAKEIRKVIRSLAPDLVIVDSLRSHCPAMENDNTAAVRQIAVLREIAAAKGTAFLLVHHVRKQRTRVTQTALAETPVLDWLTYAAGARALINQTDCRLAVSVVRGNQDDSLLLMRGHLRTRGEIGPYQIRRVWGADGNPRGYEHVSEAGHPALEAVPDDFEFAQFYQSMGTSREVAHRHLHRLMQTGLVNKIAWGKYRKTPCAQQAA